MLKSIIAGASLMMVAFVFTGCEKCTTCTYEVLGIETSTEFCGKKSEVEDFEALSETNASAAGVTATCTRD